MQEYERPSGRFFLGLALPSGAACAEFAAFAVALPCRKIDLFGRLSPRHANVGLALQAYLHRTYRDSEPLPRPGRNLRLCKGIYVEERQNLVDGAWQDRRAINAHSLHHVGRCFDTDTFIGVATHDTELIESVIGLVSSRNIDRSRLEFQMLLGVCEPLRDRLLQAVFRVRIYVPYGKDWYAPAPRWGLAGAVQCEQGFARGTSAALRWRDADPMPMAVT